MQEWFENEDQQHLHDALENRLQKAWVEEFLDPIEATGAETSDAVDEEEDSVAA